MENESKETVETETKKFNVDYELAGRKIERWGSNDNFVAPRELTLTITLCEYRNLLCDNARLTADNSRVHEEVRARDARIVELEEQVKELKLEAQVKGINEKLKALETSQIGYTYETK